MLRLPLYGLIPERQDGGARRTLEFYFYPFTHKGRMVSHFMIGRGREGSGLHSMEGWTARGSGRSDGVGRRHLISTERPRCFRSLCFFKGSIRYPQMIWRFSSACSPVSRSTGRGWAFLDISNCIACFLIKGSVVYFFPFFQETSGFSDEIVIPYGGMVARDIYLSYGWMEGMKRSSSKKTGLLS